MYLLDRELLKEGDIILDPLAGVGTTGYVAKALKRNFVMIEKEEKYTEGIKKRFHKRNCDGDGDKSTCTV